MPGGSVNGRPFRESSDSYSRTGIPCGNPRRYRSHEVVRMEVGHRTSAKPIDGPMDSIETEGQRQLQALLQKQIKTDVSVHQQLGQKREFFKGVEYMPATGDVSGLKALKDFLTLEDEECYIEEMRGYGLTNEEILFKLQIDVADDTPPKQSKLSNPDYHAARLKEIDDKIAQKKLSLSKPDTFSGVKPVSRHELELENALCKTNPHNKFLHTALVKQRQYKAQTMGSNDVMNSLPEILEIVTCSASEEKKMCSKQSRREKRHAYKDKCDLECCVPMIQTNTCLMCGDKMVTLPNCLCDHDDHQVPTCMEKPEGPISTPELPDLLKSVTKEKKEVVKSTAFMVSTGALTQFVSENTSLKPVILTNNQVNDMEKLRLLEDVISIPEEAIRRYKLSAEQVRQIPKFESYTTGEPSNVLYIKNLSSKVTEHDLASLFVRFQDDSGKLIFKLLNGRMKGQAFVTFKDISTASKALELVHGYEFKGKPVIIQFGKATF